MGWIEEMKSRIDEKNRLANEYDEAVNGVINELHQAGVKVNFNSNLENEMPEWQIMIAGMSRTVTLRDLVITKANTNWVAENGVSVGADAVVAVWIQSNFKWI